MATPRKIAAKKAAATPPRETPTQKAKRLEQELETLKKTVADVWEETVEEYSPCDGSKEFVRDRLAALGIYPDDQVDDIEIRCTLHLSYPEYKNNQTALSELLRLTSNQLDEVFRRAVSRITYHGVVLDVDWDCDYAEDVS